MALILRFLLRCIGPASLLLMAGTVCGQSCETPAFDHDRASERAYVDSLIQATKRRLLALDKLPKTPRTDTARLELMTFVGTIHRSGVFHRDSSLLLARQVIDLARQKGNIKYQIKGLMLAEIYQRSIVYNFPESVRLNYRLLRLAECDTVLFEGCLRRVYRNLGKVCGKVGQFDEAIRYLTKAITLLHRSPQPDPITLADLYQSMAGTYVDQQKLAEAETYYGQALDLVRTHKGGQTSIAFLLNDLGRLHFRLKNYPKAATYLTEAATCWEGVKNTLPQANTLADLAEVQLAMGQPTEAIRQATRALALNRSGFAIKSTAYATLAGSYEVLNNWEKAFRFQRLYTDNREAERRSLSQTETMTIKAAFDRERMETTHRQENLLAGQKYQTLRKQAEIDRLRTGHKNEALLRFLEQEKLEQKLETESLNATNLRRQHTQQSVIKQLKISQLNDGLAAGARLRQQLFAGLFIISCLSLLLFYYLQSTRRKNRELERKNREIEAALVKGQTIERKRVAAELHDRVGSLLGATKMTIQTLDADAFSSKNKTIYQNSLHLLDDAALQVRQLSHNLIPDSLHDTGLVSALRELVNKLNGANRTRFTLDYTALPQLRLTDSVEFNLYVVCLELCTNVLKHAQAENAIITLCQSGTSLYLTLSDDGVGLTDQTGVGIGLKNSRNRMQKMGGTFRVEPNVPGLGMLATVSVAV